MGSLDGISYFV